MKVLHASPVVIIVPMLLFWILIEMIEMFIVFQYKFTVSIITDLLLLHFRSLRP